MIGVELLSLCLQNIRQPRLQMLATRERSEEKLPAASVRSDLQDAASNLEAGRAGSQAN